MTMQRTGMTSTTGSSPGADVNQVLSGSSLIGDKVYNMAGEKLGELKDIVIDVDQGRVSYGVLSFGGLLGMGDKLFAIPFQALQLDKPNKRLLLNVPKEKLENAPGFDKDNWPSTADRSWGADIHRHYGFEPYWETSRTTPRH